ncbi:MULTISPECIES: Dyp-type peroxidase [unclassified Streptomyces]|uniref:Dyp-type peroxidase n=1 Tax=unclassified Streptomyces TaxID=2593676 RepID=UPI002DDB25A0|nr:Dyp-type peroxidase [Streptomyces sp. NBC_01761]WSC51658.1 Dyp-type peroxidase [Streptomyces sp. NBC_01761]WSF82508.1 Dyp-type peroxidase [Streptomyces sp. NBC_01744]
MNTAASSGEAGVRVEIDDIQSGALRPRPVPYEGKYILLRVDDRHAGRALLRRLLPVTAGGLPSADRTQDAWVAVAFTYRGLKALGVPQESLDSFPQAFREGMAARAELIGDVGESAPAHWEAPFGTGDIHIALSALSSDTAQLDKELERARVAYEDTPGVQVIWQQEVKQLPTGRTTLGFRDGISHPNIEGVGLPGSNPQEVPIKAGEFILGYPDETGNLPPMPSPDVLGRNGTYVAVRKAHTHVAAWRRYLRANSSSAEEEALLAAKMVGRWPSGAPLALAPEHDDPELAADPHRVNNFLYQENDDRGFRCPAGAHVRRVNPRDSTIIGDARMHRLIRRGTTYGPPLPEGVLEDDGAERGLVGAFIGAHIERQFEFIKAEWVNDGNFIGYPGEKDAVAGNHGGTGSVTIPEKPVRRRLRNLPSFVVIRGGEYCFLPGLRALRWIAELED